MTIECSIGIIKESDKYLFFKVLKNHFLTILFPGGKLESNESSDKLLIERFSRN